MIMKKFYFILAAAASVALASCTNDELVGNSPGTEKELNEAIAFGFNLQNMSRAGEFVGATAAEKLGNMFVVEGTKGSEQSNSPSTSVVFDNYLVGYTANSAGKTESNTNNWEYVGLQTGITGKLSGDTWTALHNGSTDAKSQTVKYWDYTQPQYDFIAWSTGTLEAVTDAAVSGSKVKVTRINTGNTLATNGFTLTALSAADLQQCYYTDITTVPKAKYGQPVTLTFKNMAAKVRVALYETVPGYSVKDVYFYTSDATPTAPTDLGAATTAATSGTDEEKAAAKSATLFTTAATLPKSGAVLVYYPHIGSANSALADYNKANVTVDVTGSTTATTQTFSTLSNFADKEGNEAAGTVYLGRDITKATFAGSAAENYYQAVVPNQNGQPLTLRVDYTLLATDGSGEEIHVYGAKAVVPATYTVWQPNYAYTYIFKISDNTNGWTSTTNSDPQGLFPITFDAVVASFTDFNAEQTTVTTVATPSITTYQQGHDKANNEYSKSQKAGKDAVNYKDLYVQVMSTGASPSLQTLTTANSLLFSVATTGAPISEASVMDALQNRTAGRNGVTLTTNGNIAISATSGTFDKIVNGVDDNPISVGAGEAAKIDIDQLDAGTYAYVYVTTAPAKDEKVYHLAAGVTDASTAANYYEVKPSDIGATAKSAGDKAIAGKVYFVKNVDAKGAFVSWTFKQTKVNDDVEGLYEASIPASKGTSTWSADYFYFDVYNQNNGAYAVKVIKVVD